MINQDGEGPSTTSFVCTLKYMEVADENDNFSGIILTNGYNLTLWSVDDFSDKQEFLYQTESIKDEKIIDYDIDQQKQLLFLVNDQGQLFK